MQITVNLDADQLAEAMEDDEEFGLNVIAELGDRVGHRIKAFVDNGYTGSVHQESIPAFLRALADEIDATE